MSGSNGTPKRPRFRVSMSDDVAAMGREALEEADAAGLGPAFRGRMHELLGDLQSDPLGTGEPIYDLRHAKLQVRKVVRAPVVVYFGVHAEAGHVFVQRIEIMPPPTI